MPSPLTQAQNDRARRLLQVHPRRTVAQIMGIAESSLWAMKRRNWIAPESNRPKRPRPTDFAIMNNRMTFDELRVHYRTANRNITRWRREIVL